MVIWSPRGTRGAGRDGSRGKCSAIFSPPSTDWRRKAPGSLAATARKAATGSEQVGGDGLGVGDERGRAGEARRVV